MFSKVIKTVTRVEDAKGKDAILFKDENGKVSYLDKIAKYNIPEIGESRECWVVSDKDTYDFIRFNVGDFHTIKDFVTNIPKVTNNDLFNLDGDIVRFINQLQSNVEYDNTIQLTLNNLKNLKKIYDKMGINSELGEFVYESLPLLQHLYNEYTNKSKNNESLEDKLIRLKKEFHDKDEFDLDLAMEMHKLEREINSVEYKYLKEYKALISKMTFEDMYCLKFTGNDKTYYCKKSMDGLSYTCINNGNKHVVKLSIIDNKGKCIDFIKNLKAFYVLTPIYLKG